MKLVYGILMFLLMAAGIYFFVVRKYQGTDSITVIEMYGDRYLPNEITIKAGDAVRFENKSGADRWPASNIHPMHNIYPEFDPQHAIPRGESWKFRFGRQGTWLCHDHLTPSISCTINVK